MTLLSSCDEKELLVQLRKGNEDAFDFFYQKHSAQILRKLYKMTRVSSISEELLQDVFVKIWEKRHLIDPEKSFKSYLFQIAQNLVYDLYRKVARDERLQSEIKKSFVEIQYLTEEGIHLKDTQQIISQAIDALPPQQKLVFTLCKIEGKSYDEVSTALGVSTSTINGHIVKATKSIKRYMFKYEDVAFVLIMSQALRDFI